MILRDVLEKALDIICDDEIDLNVSSKKLTKLISCGNMIYQELVEQYVPLKNKEELEFVDGVLLYSAFAKPVKDILSIKKSGFAYNFVMYPSYVNCNVNGNAQVNYVYHGGELSIDDNIILPPQFSENILAMGVASEYFYRSGLCDEAIFYKNRYDNAIINLTRKKSSINLKGRNLI